MPFGAVVGHQQPLAVLRRAILTSRVAPAYLFVGPPGVGKTLVALELARALNCLQGEARAEADSCGVCKSCRSIEKGIHPDVRVIRALTTLEERSQQSEARGKRPRKGANTDEQAAEAAPEEPAGDFEIEGTILKIEQIRDLITVASLQPLEARRKVFVLQRAETMNEAAANCFLKTLEEPPGDTTFLLTTSNPSALLPTILSRCQVLQFHPVPLTEARPALAELHPWAEPTTLEAVAALSGGRFGWAREMLGHPEVLAQRATLLELVATLPRRRGFEAMRLAEELIEIAESWWKATEEGKLAAQLLKRNRDRVLRTMLGELLNVLLIWFRDLAVLAADPLSEGLSNRDWAARLREVAPSYGVTQCAQACRWLEESRQAIRGNVNLRLTCEALMVRLIGLTEG